MTKQISEQTSEQTSNSVMDHLVFISDDEIEQSPELNLRQYSSTHETDRERGEFQELMESIRENGQIEPVVVRPNGGEKYILTAGSRRLRAIRQFNLLREAEGLEPVKVKAVVREGGDALRDALHENIKRKNFTPMDLALNLQLVRERYGWKGAKHSKNVAEYVGISVPQVIQLEKLFTLEDGLKDKLQDGTLSMDGALALMKVPAEQRMDTLQEAEVEERKRKGRQDDEEAEVGIQATKKAKKGRKTRQAKGGSKGITAKSVKKAAKKVAGIEYKKTLTDVKDWIEGENGPAYSQQAQEFLSYFGQWLIGKGSDKGLSGKFAQIAGKSSVVSEPEHIASRPIKVVGKKVKKASPKK